MYLNDPVFNVVDSVGAPISGAKAYFYLTGTTTLVNTYTTVQRTVANTNPVIADSAGRFPPIYLDPDITYRMKLTDAADILILDRDPIAVAEDGDETLVLSTIAALQAYNAPTVEIPELLSVISNYVAGDGGGTFRYDSTDTTTADNGGTVIVDTAGRRWKRQWSGYVQTKWWGSTGTDAVLTAAKTAAGSGGVISVNSAITLSSSATTDGFILAFDGGTIAPPASTATLTIGAIQAPDRQIFVGANVARVRATIRTAIVNVTWFGGTWNGVASDSTAINAAVAAAQNEAGIQVWFPVGNAAIDSSIVIGDGTTTTRSTTTGLTLIGLGSGAADNEFGTPNYVTSIKWVGATSATAAMIDVRGPYHNFSIQNLTLNCDSKAGIAIKTRTVFRSEITNVLVTKQTAYAIDARSYDVTNPPGVAVGTALLILRRFFSRSPANSSARGVLMAGGPVNNVAMSRCAIEDSEIEYGGASGSYGLGLYFADNNYFSNTFIQCQLAALGKDIVFFTDTTSPYPGSFPQENTFIQTPAPKGVYVCNDANFPDINTEITNGGLGFNIFLAYPESDGGPIPTNIKIKTLTHEGILYNRWAGSQNYWNGRTASATGLTTSKTYFCLIGDNAGSGTYNNMRISAPSGGIIDRLQVTLATAPGGSETRTFTLFKNGSATASTMTYGSAESGIKALTIASGISYAFGDEFALESDVSSGSVANSQASFCVSYYPLEIYA
jgi:hypothetical protein